MKNTKRIVAFILAAGLFMSNGGVDYHLMASNGNNKKISHIPETVELEDLSQKAQKRVKNAVEAAKENGENAGEIINEIGDNSIREIGVKEVLDYYFSAETVDESAVKEFSETLEENIEQEIADYTEARAERDNQENLDYVAGEQIVVFDENTSKEEIEEVVKNVSDSYEIIIDNEFVIDETLSERKKERLKALEDYKGNIVVKVNLDLDQTVEKAEEEFEKYECVEDADKNGIEEQEDIQAKLNDTYVSSQWYLEQCNFEAAWDSESTAGCCDIWVAVLDTGCRMTHKDLSDGLVTKYSVDVTKEDANGNYKKLSDLSKQYDSDHGTKCTGIIAAKNNNSIGIAGAARGWDNEACRVMAVKVSDGVDDDGNVLLYRTNICKGIVHAIESGAEVISISISGALTTGYEEAMAIAKEAGVVVVAAAGNQAGTEKRYPAAMDYVIAVGGTDENNKKCSFSNYGDWVNIVAPACNYVSTTTTSDTAYAKGINGTSFATPLVAAAVGEMLSMNPDITVSQIKSYLYGKATDINSSYFTCGLLNAGLSVQRAKYEEFKNTEISLTNIKALSNNKIRIYWDASEVYGPEKILIYRATSKNGTYSKIKTLTGDDVCNTYYTDSGLKEGTTYYYKVRVAMKYGSGHKYTPYSAIKSVKAQK